MNKYFSKLLAITAVACVVVFSGCGLKLLEQYSNKLENENKTQKKEAAFETSIITDYNWQATNDGSLLVCETDGTFKYYRSAEDFTDGYFEGNYEFYIGEDAVTHVTRELSEYGVTEEELENLFDMSEVYDESNFVCLVLNKDKCIIDGKNQLDAPNKTPYYGFCLENDAEIGLDVVNLNTANYALFIANK